MFKISKDFCLWSPTAHKWKSMSLGSSISASGKAAVIGTQNLPSFKEYEKFNDLL